MIDSDMNGRIKLYVKFTLKDVRDFCISKVYRGTFSKILLIPYFILLGIVSITLLISLFTFQRAPELLVFVIGELLILVLICSVFEFLPYLIMYLAYRNNYKKSKSIRAMQCYEVSRESLVISSEEASTTIKWHELFKIQEFKRCFLIYQSSAKILILPKRCFESQEQLEEFRNILKGCVQREKLKLKNYKLTYSSPDYCDTDFEALNSGGEKSVEVNEDQKPEIMFEVVLDKKEYIKFNFIYYYMKPIGIVLTIIGICLLVKGLIDVGQINNYGLIPKMLCLLSLVFGSFLTLLMPLTIFISSNRAFDNDALIKKPVLYKIYKDHYVVEHPSSVSNSEWTKLVKVVNAKQAIFLFITTNMVHMIPKRAFEGREDDLLKFESILKEHCGEKLKKRF